MKNKDATNSTCGNCDQIKSTRTLKNFLIFILENDKYRWGRVVEYNKRKRSEIALEVRKIRDSKFVKKYNWTDDYTKPSTNMNTKLAKWKQAKLKKWKSFDFNGNRHQTSDFIQDRMTKRLKKKK